MKIKRIKRFKRANPTLIANVVHDVENGLPTEEIAETHKVSKEFVYRHAKKASNRKGTSTQDLVKYASHVKEAIVYLSMAEKRIAERIGGAKGRRPTTAEIMTLMALNVLRGE